MKVVRQELTQGFSLAIDTPDGHKVLPASIPGSIHTDLIAAGLIGDIRIDGTEVEQEWIRNADSLYTAKVPAHTGSGNYELKFDGLDTLATVSIDGAVKLQSENMHRAFVVDISDVASGGFDLEIAFQAPFLKRLSDKMRWGHIPILMTCLITTLERWPAVSVGTGVRSL